MAALAPLSLSELSRLAHDWQREVIRPLRSVRQRLRSPFAGHEPGEWEGVRDAVGAAELAAEQVEQVALARSVRTLPERPWGLDGSACARRNLEAYLELTGVRATPAVGERLSRLLAAAIPPGGEDASGADQERGAD